MTKNLFSLTVSLPLAVIIPLAVLLLLLTKHETAYPWAFSLQNVEVMYQ